MNKNERIKQLESKVNTLEEYIDNIERKKYEKIFELVRDNFYKVEYTYSIYDRCVSYEIKMCHFVIRLLDSGEHILSLENLTLNEKYTEKLFNYIDERYKINNRTS